MNTYKNLVGFIFILLVSVLGISCSDDKDKDNDYGNEKDGYALRTAEGHSFQFYNSKSKLVFKIAVSQDEIIAVIDNGAVIYGEPTFNYTKTGDNEAECWVSIKYQFSLGGDNSYGAYMARVEMLFTGPKKGTYRTYDIITDKYKSSGTFTIDDKSVSTPIDPDTPSDPDIPDDPNVPDDPVIPDVPKVPSTAIKSNIYEVYEDRIIVDFSFDKNYAGQIIQMGHCWSTRPNPTVFDATVYNVLNSGGETGRVTCELDGKPGTTYYVRAYAQVGTEFIYFNEMKVQSMGGDIKLSAYYSEAKDEIAVDYDISRNETFTLYFYAPLTVGSGNIINKNLGIVGKDKGIKYVPDYYCYYYYAYLVETSTGIRYCSKVVNKY